MKDWRSTKTPSAPICPSYLYDCNLVGSTAFMRPFPLRSVPLLSENLGGHIFEPFTITGRAFDCHVAPRFLGE